MAKFLGGFGLGALCTAWYMNTRKLKVSTYEYPAIDHVVIRTGDKGNECKAFYRLLGLDIEREKEAEEFDKSGRKTGVIFPIARLNSKQAIDLFPNSTKHVWCKETDGNVDHVCLVVSADEHLNCLQRLKDANFKCVKQFRAFGAQGYGWSTYFNDPTGLYIELRNYEKNRWKEVEAFANTMLRDENTQSKL